MSGLIHRRIVGIGEALLTERGGEITPDGLAVEVATWAARCGHVGIPVSRLGQDDRAARIIGELRERGIDVSHLQSDPDLPTPRRIIRMIAGRKTAGSARLDDRAAFDNMQWDFDLVDVAQEADAVVFGMTAQRGGLSGSVIRRFLSECTNALRIFDLTNRAANAFDRAQALRCMELADIIIVDQVAIKTLLRHSESPDFLSSEIVRQVLRMGRAVMAVTVCADSPPTLHAGESTVSATQPWTLNAHAPMRIALLHSQLRGDEPATTATLIDRIAKHVREKPDEDVPEALLQ